jgi:hypothetical protein
MSDKEKEDWFEKIKAYGEENKKVEETTASVKETEAIKENVQRETSEAVQENTTRSVDDEMEAFNKEMEALGQKPVEASPYITGDLGIDQYTFK